ncbi:glycoside hydrolase family 13 protein [Geosporobacter ferrireducens]|uniref:glycoside hydrolase family 13 protein n=1 Tax=Geosporobacter ferrireducens TaxID=1424294 RepID=UPI0009F606CF|nr:glycoside hydrolase family 13 protein [Geosporobacter ferrireducens]MTI55506.1 glycoside hydrolase family 13 protein [Geosporobacter ferrireducens]
MCIDWIYHNSHEKIYRTPFGALPCSARVSLRIKIASEVPPDTVFLRLWNEEEKEKLYPMSLLENQRMDRIYHAEIETPQTPKLIWYFFIIHFQNQTYFYGNNASQSGGAGEIYTHEPPSYQITVFQPNTRTPDWFKSSVMYQVYVDRFFPHHPDGITYEPAPKNFFRREWSELPEYERDPDTHRVIRYDYFGGNLQGLIAKLPYLHELGIGVLYLNPIFEAHSNHKYDTADYHRIDPMYGDQDTFQRLCAEGKKLGILVILDGVFSHTGSNSIYFNREGTYSSLGAYQSTDSPYYSWYHFDHHPGSYDCWWGIDTMPNVDETNSLYQDFILYQENSVIKHWMKLGAKGWRLDVADELPDSFIKSLRAVMHTIDDDSVLIGEIWEDASNKTSYGELREYLLGEELDSPTNYPFRKILLDFFLERIDAEEMHMQLIQLYENYPLHHFYAAMNLIGSHDVPRVLTLLGEAPEQQTLSKKDQKNYQLSASQRELAIKRLKLLSLMQMCFPGVPCIYYGDEIGLEGYSDPYNRAPYPWGKENLELLSWYKAIIALRNQHAALQTGSWHTAYARDDVYGLVRQITGNQDVFGQVKQNGTFLLFINRSTDQQRDIEVDIRSWCNNALISLLDNQKEFFINEGILRLTLNPLEAKIMLQR